MKISTAIALNIKDAYHLMHGTFASARSRVNDSPIKSARRVTINGFRYVLIENPLGFSLKNDHDRMFALAAVNRHLGRLGSDSLCWLVRGDIATNLIGSIRIKD